MEAIASKQGVERWAECTPLHLLYIPLIKKLMPDALIVHIIRDGRDVAACLHRMGWIRALPWDRSRDFLARAIFWGCLVERGRRHAQALGPDYMEVHYEDLVRNPRQTLECVGKFIEHDLDYHRIQQVALETVRTPNSSFCGDSYETAANSIGRWRRIFTPSQIRDIEASIGHLLTDTGYPPESPAAELDPSLAVRSMSVLCPLCLDARLWLKSNTPLGRIADRRIEGLASCVDQRFQ